MNIKGRNATRKDQAKLAKPLTKKALKASFEAQLKDSVKGRAAKSVRRPIRVSLSKAEQWNEYLNKCVISGNVSQTKVDSWKPEYI